MEQIAIVARLKSGAEPRAAELIAHGSAIRARRKRAGGAHRLSRRR